ncbi:DUF6527 family protein [Rhodanobacter glycinis]|uniref:Uncharacterized protein n=1 Tax=Rhodanobacter glycinis TaxID=582702 RepID=A0A1I4F408_9GAMM|nr:DUF6527 family protein [Rhodanobacter glycinis]SFL12664.1 hypothetical protein SAMN05192579_11587 [Rhodanobacter glycinis]
MTYVYEAVKRIPTTLSPGVIYHNVEFELAALRCACGCGHRITLLVPDGHRISVQGAVPSVTPSILVGDAPCHSHYFISSGEVEWLRAFSPSQAEAVMRGQVARHVSADRASRSLWERWRRAVLRAIGRVMRFFNGSR